jgi:hypothetical protein
MRCRCGREVSSSASVCARVCVGGCVSEGGVSVSVRERETDSDNVYRKGGLEGKGTSPVTYSISEQSEGV